MRDTRIDSMRGLLLVIMTLNHLMGPFSELTEEPFGFVSAAEGFVLLSAYTSAVTSKKGAMPLGAMFDTGLRRAWRIYKYHALLLLVLAVMALALPTFAYYWQDRFFTGDGSLTRTVVAGLLLAHQPIFFDILPMYVLFLLFTPFLLWMLRSGGGVVLLLASGGLWMLGQAIHPVPDLVTTIGWETKTGLFNLLSWQVLWVVGLMIGFEHAHLGNNPVVRRPGAVGAAVAVVMLGFLLRHDLVPVSAAVLVHFDKAALGGLRLLNVGAQLVIVLYGLALLPRDAGLPFFRFIGRYSLQVFTYHVFVVYAIVPFAWRVKANGPVAEALFHVLIVASLALPAFLYRRYRRRLQAAGAVQQSALAR